MSYHPAIDKDIDDQDEKPQDELKASRQERRVEERDDVAFDKVRGVGCSSSLYPKPVFQRGQGAGPVHEFNNGTPDRSGNMEIGPAALVQNKETAEDDEKDKKEMNDDDQICEEFKKHNASVVCRRFTV
jgi:hypothetical protein